MTDIVGPANAPNTVTARPAETRVFGAADTWFQDCSSGTANDGTRVMAAWLNAVIASLRQTIRANGSLIAGGPVVSEDNSDAMFANAIQYLIQRGQPTYGDDTGTANNVVVTLNPAPKEYKKGMMVVATIAANNNGASVLNVNGLGAKAVMRSDGTPLQWGDLLAGAMQAFVYDGSKFQLAWLQRVPGQPIYLQASRDYFVSNSGSDGNDGTTLQAAWATLQYAASFLTRFNLNGYSINVHVADGTYAAVRLPNMAGSGFVRWIGNHATPSNCTIAGNGVTAISAQNCGGAHSFDGFRLTATGAYTTDPMCGVNCSGNGTNLTLTNIDWNVCSGSHLGVTQAGIVTYAGNMIVSGAPQGSNPGMTVGCHVFCGDGGIIQIPSLTSVTLTITVPITLGNGGAWVECFYLGFCQIVYAAITGAGNVTGKKFFVTGNAIISVAGAGDGHYPGTIAGTRQSGGIYE
ncbi:MULTISPECIES: hypothetical protein [unclassified Bradyrhizobium]|uniref:hypothetical protein n=1 Tax=unclassified Bradyrhizobium TaxID=2631580 RepID=UPI0028E7897C|nr:MULTISPECIES: hypothetical protein [unclassified Bradyrhizobium]